MSWISQTHAIKLISPVLFIYIKQYCKTVYIHVYSLLYCLLWGIEKLKMEPRLIWLLNFTNPLPCFLPDPPRSWRHCENIPLKFPAWLPIKSSQYFDLKVVGLCGADFYLNHLIYRCFFNKSVFFLLNRGGGSRTRLSVHRRYVITLYTSESAVDWEMDFT